MARRFFVLVALFALLVLTVGSAAAQDAKTVLQAASKAMGANNLKTIQITGTGYIAGVGQSYSANDDWPTSYARPGCGWSDRTVSGSSTPTPKFP